MGSQSSPLDTAAAHNDLAYALSMNSLAPLETSKEIRTTQKFGSISGIDDAMYENLNRVTGLSPTHHNGISGIRATSREDANLLLFLQENEQHGVFLHDMG